MAQLIGRVSSPSQDQVPDEVRTAVLMLATQPCILCGSSPSDPHHLRFAQPRAMSRKVSDEFVVPLCRTHHRELHAEGNEASWWHDMGIDPLPIAKDLWAASQPAARPTNTTVADSPSSSPRNETP